MTVKLRTIDPAAVQLEELLERGTEFHGHLGPFLVCGLRMGLLALRELDSWGHFDLQAVVETGTTPPLSCLIDGIQVATGCTLGKGNTKSCIGTRRGPPLAKVSASSWWSSVPRCWSRSKRGTQRPSPGG